MQNTRIAHSAYRRLPALIAAAACFTVLSTAHAGDATEAEIQESAARWDAAFNAGDAEALSNLYTEDATLVPKTGAIVTGRPAIREFWTGVFKAGVSAHKIDLVSVRNSGDLAITVGKWTAEGRGSDGTTKQYDGKLVNILQAQPDGQRRSVLHSWN